MTRGFTLVELSIVLVIIGLVIGGVLFGREMVKNAEMRRFMSNHEELETAINTFKGKYNALPGDFDNATTIWGEANSTCNFTTAGTGTQTCNGNGNTLIDFGNQHYPENILMWEHLGNALMIAGEFTGAADTSCSVGSNCVNTDNSPLIGIDEAIARVYFHTGSAVLSKRASRHIMWVIGNDGAGNAVRDNFTPEFQLELDNKYDDGYVNSGFISHMSGSTGCDVDPDGDGREEYNMSREGQDVCSLVVDMRI